MLIQALVWNDLVRNKQQTLFCLQHDARVKLLASEAEGLRGERDNFRLQMEELAKNEVSHVIACWLEVFWWVEYTKKEYIYNIYNIYVYI